MLSTNTPSLQSIHRRQNSTPTLNVDSKVSLRPATENHEHGMHRRGLSLNHRMHVHEQHKPQQDFLTVSRTNQGPNLQHIMRETQPQSTSRPGQAREPEDINNKEHYQHQYSNQSQVESYGTSVSKKLSINEISAVSSECGRMTPSKALGSHPDMSAEVFLEKIARTPLKDIDDLILELPKHLNQIHHENLGEPKNIDNSNNFFAGLSSQHYSDVITRPHTPPNQMQVAYTPLTPATTPYSMPLKAHQATSPLSKQAPLNRRDTVRAPRAPKMKKSSSTQQESRTAGRRSRIPSPPNTAPLLPSNTFDIVSGTASDFMSTSNLKIDLFMNNSDYDSSYYSPMSSRISPAMSSFQSSPVLQQINLFPDLENMLRQTADGPQLRVGTSRSSVDFGYPSSATTPIKRSQSTDARHRDLPGAVIEDTGVTEDDIAAFIQGPDPGDGKWTCLHPKLGAAAGKHDEICGRSFGRKENVKSHVQTHLGDRQFQCVTCLKQFVRQHDLKRHAKIHSGDKPYPCSCGNSFARQDALTRHRQRGMCVGAFEGTPRQEVKRGRPKKASRPDTEERREKAAKTRQRVLERQGYPSSISGSSESSMPSPPEEFDDMDLCGGNIFNDARELHLNTRRTSPDIFSFTPPATPRYSTGNTPSFQPGSRNGSPSPLPKMSSITTIFEDVEDLFPSIQESPSRSATSQYGSPPELELSSSSPIAPKFFDFDAGCEEPIENDAAAEAMAPTQAAEISKSQSHQFMNHEEMDRVFRGVPFEDSFALGGAFLSTSFDDPWFEKALLGDTLSDDLSPDSSESWDRLMSMP